MYRKSMKYAESGIVAGKSGWIENPRTSMLWKTAGVRKLLKIWAVVVDANCCQYGCPYRKATRFLVWGLAVVRLFCAVLWQERHLL